MAPKAKVSAIKAAAKAKVAATKAKSKATTSTPKAKAVAKASASSSKVETKAKSSAKAKATPDKAAKTAPDKAENGKVPLDIFEPPQKKAKTESNAFPVEFLEDDDLELVPLFQGGGRGGAEWARILMPVIRKLPRASTFIGPGRDKRIVPVRELTFQALKPNPPGDWSVISFGQSPYPRLESATGIAHFDNTIKSWEDKRFSVVTSMRCIIKAASIQKYEAKDTKVGDLRLLMKEKSTVGPVEWFQAMLVQGVLLMNAALTVIPPEDKTQRAIQGVQDHTNFWQPVVEAVVDAILEARGARGQGVVFAWWGTESLKTKKALSRCFARHPNVKVEHVEHKNPAAMYDSFCDEPNVFRVINEALKRMDLREIDWLPSSGWKDNLTSNSSSAQNASNNPKISSSFADQMGAFLEETQELHKMYLERLMDGLKDRKEELDNITGVMMQALVPLPDTFDITKLKTAASDSLKKVKSLSIGDLSADEAAAIHLYTTNHLYKELNAALRAEDRTKVKKYLRYLRLFFEAARKLPYSVKPLYRGVALDLRSQYSKGADVTWWSVSSCTPDLKVASSFASSSKASTLFIIKPRTSVGIRHLSMYTHEEEFIFLPGVQFKVTDVLQKGSGCQITLEELDLPPRVG